MFLSGLLTAILAQAVTPDTKPRPPSDADKTTLALTVDEAVEIALDRSFRVQRSARSAKIADLQVDSARAGIRPRFDSHLRAGQTQTYSQFTGNAYRFANANPDFSANISAVASLPVDLWGVNRRRIDQSKLSRDSVQINLDQSALDTALEVRDNYYRALQSKGRLDANLALLVEIDDLIAKAKARPADIVDYLKAERDLAAQQTDESRMDFQLARARLAQSLRLPATTDMTLESNLPQVGPLPSEDRLFDIASKHRADLKQAEINLEQARLRRTQAEDFRRPTFGLDAFVDQGVTGRSPRFGDQDSGRSLSAGIAARLTVPLVQYDGGVLGNARKIADIQADQALADHAESLERARDDIDRLLIALTRLSERVASLPDISLAQAVERDAEQRLLSAPSTDAPALLAQVTNARENLRRARLTRNDTLASFASNLISLSRAVGDDLLE